jgi:hypothetical protein
MVKVKDSKNIINKLAKKIKITALQLKVMRSDLKQLKDQAKAAMLVDNKTSVNSKKLTAKKQPVKNKKPASTARRKKVVNK